MKKTIIMAVLASAALASCDQKELISENVESESLKIMTSINMIESRAGFVEKKDFTTNDEMGLFLYKSTGWGEEYPRFSSQNNKSTKTASTNMRGTFNLFEISTSLFKEEFSEVIKDTTSSNILS